MMKRRGLFALFGGAAAAIPAVALAKGDGGSSIIDPAGLRPWLIAKTHEAAQSDWYQPAAVTREEISSAAKEYIRNALPLFEPTVRGPDGRILPRNG